MFYIPQPDELKSPQVTHPLHPPSPAPSFTHGKKLLSDQRKPLRRWACVVGASGALFPTGAWDGPPQIFRSLRFPLLALTPLSISLLRPVTLLRIFFPPSPLSTQAESELKLYISSLQSLACPDFLIHTPQVEMASGLGNLMGKVALISGASSGIGAATAILFSKLGASLALAGRNEENLQKVGSQCQKTTPLLLAGDLSCEEDTKRILNETIKQYGKLNILVNCAGILESGSIENTSLEQFDRVFNVNVRSIYHLTMLAVPHLIATKGNIVNVSSVNGMRSFPGVLAYNMSKSAVDQFTRCVALELAPKQVRVNGVNPGVTITDLHRRGGMDEEKYQKFLEHCRNTHALGRPGEAEEVARAIAFLASEDASFITGASVPVDGGRHAMCPR
ncbi:hypothetical protein C0Q70_10611 [Pomacea canaliculata]|uniref:Ketoreductase domain-containing protein n=2 Tax=Pomacea canaliculata TaxID=400727 RepID=A0A2T7P3P0_POMCA|nr:hypothetical protein C0Q70_10611 [Pomacea canaliculata]